MLFVVLIAKEQMKKKKKNKSQNITGIVLN